MIKSIKYGLVFLLCITLLQASLASAVEPGASAPNWTLLSGRGETINFYRDSRDKVSVLIYWASWCPYCASLMPHLQDLSNQYDERKVKFYAMNIMENADPVQHMREQGYGFELIRAADGTMGAYGVLGTPMVFVIDDNHIVRYRRVADTPDQDVKAAVKEAIDSALN